MFNDSRPSAAGASPEIGFFSIVHLESLGYCGGYLVLNENCRPLEFHCTFPVKPERSQEILYGQSLRPYLYAEHIGRPLIAKARTGVGLVLVNQLEALPLGTHIPQPVAWIGSREGSAWRHQTTDARHRDYVQERLQHLESTDLLEPFERIIAAIEEAHAVTRQECA